MDPSEVAGGALFRSALHNQHVLFKILVHPGQTLEEFF